MLRKKIEKTTSEYTLKIKLYIFLLQNLLEVLLYKIWYKSMSIPKSELWLEYWIQVFPAKKKLEIENCMVPHREKNQQQPKQSIFLVIFSTVRAEFDSLWSPSTISNLYNFRQDMDNIEKLFGKGRCIEVFFINLLFSFLVHKMWMLSNSHAASFHSPGTTVNSDPVQISVQLQIHQNKMDFRFQTSTKYHVDDLGR